LFQWLFYVAYVAYVAFFLESAELMRDMNVNIPTGFEGAWSEIHDELDELPTKRQVQKEGGLYLRERVNMIYRSAQVLLKMQQYLPLFKTVFASQQQEVERRYAEAVTAGETWRGMAAGRAARSMSMPRLPQIPPESAWGNGAELCTPQLARTQPLVHMQTLLEEMRQLQLST
jgi:hypothetical protein